MFNKEESKRNSACKIADKINFKRIGTIILTMTLLSSLNNVKAENQGYHDAMNEYYDRVEQYMNEKEYNMDFFKLYHTGRFIINDMEIKKDRVFIVAGYVNNELKMSLYTGKIGKIDFLTGEDIDYEDPVLIPLIQTTLFETLLNEKLIMVNDRNMTFDMTRLDEIREAINNWDGLAHSLVPETDAYTNKVFIERDNKSYEKK